METQQIKRRATELNPLNNKHLPLPMSIPRLQEGFFRFGWIALSLLLPFVGAFPSRFRIVLSAVNNPQIADANITNVTEQHP